MASDDRKHNLNSLSKNPPTEKEITSTAKVKESKNPVKMESPVLFNFRDDYGLRLFLDLQKEIYFGRGDLGRRLFLGAVEEMDGHYSSADVYAFSSEADMIASFIKDGFF